MQAQIRRKFSFFRPPTRFDRAGRREGKNNHEIEKDRKDCSCREWTVSDDFFSKMFSLLQGSFQESFWIQVLPSKYFLFSYETNLFFRIWIIPHPRSPMSVDSFSRSYPGKKSERTRISKKVFLFVLFLKSNQESDQKNELLNEKTEPDRCFLIEKVT